MSSSIDIKRIVHNGEDIIELKDANDNVLWNPYVNGSTPISFYNTYDIGDNVLGDDTMTTEYYEESGSITIRSSNPPYRDEVYSLHGTTTTSKVHLTQNDIYSLGYANGLYFYAIGIFDFLSENVDYIITGNEFFNLTDFNDNDLLSGQDSIYLQLYTLFGLQMTPGNFTATDEKNSHSSENTWLASTKWVVVIGTSQEKASLPEDIYLSFTFKLYGDLIDPDMFKIMFMRYPRYVDKINAAQTYMIPEVEDVKVPKDLKNYRIYGNTETKTRSYSGSAPLNFPIVDGSVSNYKIYGNTVNGESVGEKTANLFDSNINVISGYLSDEGILKPANETSQITFDYIPIISGTYTFTYTVPSAYDLWFGVCTYDESRTFQSRLVSEYSGAATFTIPDTTKYIRISLRGYNKTPIIMLNEGSTTLPYEPYGFKIPITNNSETSNIYLDEPLTKSGNNADYIDYAEQKRYNADGTSEDITLPALPSQSSSNSLSVGTAVQPSSLAVDVDEVVSCGDKVTDSQSVNYGKYKIHVTLTADSTETTDIYLDEPLAKSGNNTDYIDYATQKRHNSDGTESSVTLPEISTLAGTNTLSVGTEVQPSEVEIKGKIKAVQEGGGQDES